MTNREIQRCLERYITCPPRTPALDTPEERRLLVCLAPPTEFDDRDRRRQLLPSFMAAVAW
jgi:hypothetical protein